MSSRDDSWGEGRGSIRCLYVLKTRVNRGVIVKLSVPVADTFDVMGRYVITHDV
jgi:hypothetical protein